MRTREALVAAAATVFSRDGYSGATAKSIAVEAGVATGSFYQYFSDKDALLREIAVERLARVANGALAGLGTAPITAEPLPREVRRRLEEIVEVVTVYHREDPGLHAVLSERRHADAELDRITSAAEQALVQRIAEQLARWQDQGDHLATAFVLFGMVEGAVHAHVLGESMVSDERFTAALVSALMRIALPDRK